MTPLFWAIGAGIVVFFRWLGHYEPTWDWLVITVVASLTTAPVGFLAGIGAFDYWLYYISGRPTRAEDHSGHGAYSWRDYFKVNTDHKVIGVQYLVTTFFFFVVGRADGDDLPRRAREPGHAVRRHADLQRAHVRARGADDLPLHHPRVRRARELRRAADARRAGHGLPAPERALVLAAADRRDHVPGRASSRRAAPSAPAGRATRRSPSKAPTATSSSRWASSGRARPRS